MVNRLPDWSNLSLAEQVAQMLVVRASGHLFDHQIEYPVWEPPAAVIQHWLQDLGVGGVILLGGTAAEVGLRTQQLQAWAKYPLLICADIEEGVGQRFAGATWFPPPMAIGEVAKHDLALALQQAEAMGSATAQEALAIGINWVLAPVVDVNNNPQNPVINIRAWGETPETVSQLTSAFIQGAQQHPVLTTAKHFPGHGDTAIDSHLDLPVIEHDRIRLNQVELAPFRQAIAAQVDTVMTAHLQLPMLDPDWPATLSRPILTGLLRQEMGFGGLIVTDALVMGAITARYGANEAAVLAVEAGADVLMMPVDPTGAIQAICTAVQRGRISETQIIASLERIGQAKQKVCTLPLAGDSSHAWEEFIAPPIHLEHIAQPATTATVQNILEASLRLHHPALSHFDRLTQPPLRNLIMLDDALNCTFLNRQAPAILLPSKLGYALQIIDHATPPIDGDDMERADTLLQLFIRGNPFRSSTALLQRAEQWLKFLLKTDQIQAVVIYGSPYAAEQLITHLPPEIPYAFSYGQIPAAQTVALETLFPSEASLKEKGMAIDLAGLQEFTD